MYSVLSNYFITLTSRISFSPSELTIGLEQDAYSAQEDIQQTVQVCAEILQGSIQRGSGVTFTFVTQDGLAGICKVEQ